MSAMNENCEYVRRRDYNDCAHAGGGRAAPTREWCPSCLDTYRLELIRALENLRRFPGTASVEENTLAALRNLAARISALERSIRMEILSL